LVKGHARLSDVKRIAASFGKALDAKGFAEGFRSAFDPQGFGNSFARGFNHGAELLITPIRWGLNSTRLRSSTSTMQGRLRSASRGDRPADSTAAGSCVDRSLRRPFGANIFRGSHPKLSHRFVRTRCFGRHSRGRVAWLCAAALDRLSRRLDLRSNVLQL